MKEYNVTIIFKHNKTKSVKVESNNNVTAMIKALDSLQYYSLAEKDKIIGLRVTS